MKLTLRLMWMGGLLLPIFSLYAAPAVEEEGESSASPGLQEMLNASLDRFTEEDGRKLEQARAQYRKILTELQTGAVDEQRMEELTAEGRKVWPILRRLKDKRRRWENRVLAPEDRPGEESSGPDTFLSRLSTEPDEEFDTEAFYELLLEFWNLGNPHDSNYPRAGEWEALAMKFDPFVHTLGTSFDVKRYVLRAWLLQARCHLRASVQYFQAGQPEEQYASYTKGVEMMAALYKVCRDWSDHEEADVLQTIPVVTRPLRIKGVEQIGTKKDWSERGGLNSQTPTGTAARQALTDYCPWGFKNFIFLQNIGVFDGFDWRVLRPYGGDDPKKISVAELKPRSVPAHVRRDVASARAGKVEHAGAKAVVDWEWRSEPTYTVWFVSPRVHDMKASEVIGYISDAVTLGRGGIVDISLSVAEKGLKKLVPQDIGDKQIGEFYISTAKNFNTYKLNDQWEWESGEVGGLSFLKSGFEGLLSYLEEKEMEMLFDAIDPTNKSVIKATGNPLTYDGTHMPMVVIRANMVAVQKVPDYEYRKIWNHTRYYFFDPRALLETDKQFDLRNVPAKLPREADYLAGHTDIHEATWPLFPNVDRSKWGTRLVITSTAPKMQRLLLTVPGETLKRWKKGLSENKTLAAVLHLPGPEKRTIIREFKKLEPNYGGESSGTRERPRPRTHIRNLGGRTPLISSDSRGELAAATFRLFNKHVPRSQCPGWERTSGYMHVQVKNPLHYEFIELATEYQVDVVVCERGDIPAGIRLPEYAYDPLTHEKKGSTVMRVAPRSGLDPTGRIDKTSAGELTFVQHFRAPGREHDISPEGGGTVFPPSMKLCYAYSGTLTYKGTGAYDRDDASVVTEADSVWLCIGLAPAPRGWHHILVQHGGHTFHAWDYNYQEIGGCYFMVEVPLEVGRGKFNVRCVTLKDVPPLTIPVVRKRDSSPPRLNWEGTEELLQRKIRNLKNAGTAERRAKCRLAVLEAKAMYIEKYALIDKWDTVQTALDQMFEREWLSAEEQRLLSKGALFDLVRRTNRLYAEAAYHQTDVDGFARAMGRYFNIRWMELTDEGGNSAEWHDFSRVVARSTRTLISLGGKQETIASFHGFYKKVRNKAGINGEKHDPIELQYITYGQEH